MKLKYTPEGTDDTREWEVDFGKFLVPECIVIEKITGGRYGDFAEEVASGSMLAMSALLYVLLKRDQPTLRYDQVVFTPDEVDLVMSDDQAKALLELLESQLDQGHTFSTAQIEALEELRAQVYPAGRPEDDEADSEEPVADDAAGSRTVKGEVVATGAPGPKARSKKSRSSGSSSATKGSS